MKIENIEQTKTYYLELLQNEPHNVEALHALGILAARQGDFIDALNYIQTALALTPTTQIYNSLGNIWYHLGKNMEAIANYEKAIELDPTYFAPYVGLGNAYWISGSLEKAQVYYELALKLNPQSTDALYNLALIDLKKNRPELALNNLQQLLQIEPLHTKALHQIAQLLYQSNELTKAASYYNKLLEIEAHVPEALYNLGNIMLRQKNYPKALKNFLRLLTQQQDLDIYFNIGIIYMEQEQHQEAIQYFTEALNKDPNHIPTLINLGAVYLKLNQHENAQKCYQKLLELQPENLEYTFILQAIQQDNTAQNKIYTAAPKEYLENLFNQYAPYFEKHLAILDYKVPNIIKLALNAEINLSQPNLTILDLGCGTGLVGQQLRSFAQKLIGVDIAEKMLELAKEKNIYDEIHQGEMLTELAKMREIDLIVVADTLVYLGDLTLFMQCCKSALKPNGLLLFTIEQSQQYPYVLQKTARFAHNKKYIEELAAINKFTIVRATNEILRRDRGDWIEGYLFLLKLIS